MARKIVITSGKGGVGKTTCCALLGSGLTKLGAKVVMLDVDVGLNNLDISVGLDEKVKYDIVDVAEGKCRIRQALIQHDKFPLLYLLPSAHQLNVGKVDCFAIKSILEELNYTFDYILLDCPAGIEKGFHRAIFGASEAIIVTNPSITSLRDASKVSTILCGCGIESMSLIVNRFRKEFLKTSKLTPDNIAKCLDLPLLGEIMENDDIVTLSANGNVLELKEFNEFMKLAKRIHFGLNQDKNDLNIFKKIFNRGAI